MGVENLYIARLLIAVRGGRAGPSIAARVGAGRFSEGEPIMMQKGYLGLGAVAMIAGAAVASVSDINGFVDAPRLFNDRPPAFVGRNDRQLCG